MSFSPQRSFDIDPYKKTMLTAMVATPILPFANGQTSGVHPDKIWGYTPQPYHYQWTERIIGNQLFLSGSTSSTLGTEFTEKQAQNAYALVASRILELTQQKDIDEDDYDGAAVPTKYALERTLVILYETYKASRSTFPPATVSTAFDGGIRVQWIYPNFSLRLVIPGNESGNAYIYFEKGEEYGTEDASSINLIKRLKWLQRILRHVELV